MTLVTELLSSPHFRLMFSGRDKVGPGLELQEYFSEIMHVFAVECNSFCKLWLY